MSPSLSGGMVVLEVKGVETPACGVACVFGRAVLNQVEWLVGRRGEVRRGTGF